MARKTIYVSDLTGKPIDEKDAVIVTAICGIAGISAKSELSVPIVGRRATTGDALE